MSQDIFVWSPIVFIPPTRQFCRLDPVSMSFVSSRPNFQFATISLFTPSAVMFTPPTRTRQDSFVSSASVVGTSHKIYYLASFECALFAPYFIDS